MNSSKVASYLGFAIKSGNIIFGYDNLRKYRGRSNPLVLYDNTFAPKATQKLIELCRKNSWQIYLVDVSIEQLIHRNCKVVAITDENMARAIIQNI